MLKLIHSSVSILVVTLIIFSIVNAFVKLKSKESYKKNDYLIAIITALVAAIQLILGAFSYYFSIYYQTLREFDFKTVMQDATLRFYIIEHPLMMIIGALLIIIGFYKHLKKKDDVSKFKILAWYFGVAFVFTISRIPWEQWFKSF